ncbi:putative salt tolerance-like protein [Platanthera guangdongensis]|uniref:Salt tolerance-like protein n=1 Tax=Platanthera guangdongensis TaxID=2320717 RepID=A0ABR2MVD8_9ASPA
MQEGLRLGKREALRVGIHQTRSSTEFAGTGAVIIPWSGALLKGKLAGAISVRSSGVVPLAPPAQSLRLFRRLVGARCLAGALHIAMKLQCDVCGAKQAFILCCADEVVLCTGCNAHIHSTNKLAGKHHRFSLQFQRRVYGARIESISL